MALNQHPSSVTAVPGTDKGELCTQKESAAIEDKEPNQPTQVIGSALQVILQCLFISILCYSCIIVFLIFTFSSINRYFFLFNSRLNPKL